VSRVLHSHVSPIHSKPALKPAKPKSANDTVMLERRVAELTRANQVLTQQIHSMEKQISDINDQAFLDPLTHLPNRQLLLDRLQLAVTNSARNGQEGAVLYLDLDHFKAINDTYGHHLGNLLLQQVAERLVTNVRVSDTVAHVSGDEFVIVFQSLGKHNLKAATHARKIARKLQDVLSKPYRLESTSYICTVSIGIMLFSPAVTKSEDLVQQAAIAMYQAKKSGRNTYQFFDPEMQKAIQARATLEDELRTALERKQFQLYYQVQVNSEGKPIGAESLIRWVHPERGIISPMDFIPLCEETGMIVPIGYWVLNAACEQLAAWQKHPSTCDLVLAVNVSAKQFSQPDFVKQVVLALYRFNIPPQLLKLELTEGMLVQNIEDTIRTMKELCRLGVGFSLDDFGTGYSSLQYLKRLPLAQIKIDQSFVRDIAHDAHDKSIVRTIIAMANNMELNVIAEGVETEEQQQILMNKGCSTFQGYYFGRPVPIDTFNAVLTSYYALQ
jgi:diguanylate cyclase (GGDEF)-like protein